MYTMFSKPFKDFDVKHEKGEGCAEDNRYIASVYAKIPAYQLRLLRCNFDARPKRDGSVKAKVVKYDSTLHEVCAALGWQGGTIHQALAEIKRLKAKESNHE